jgi:hypothetical protein
MRKYLNVIGKVGLSLLVLILAAGALSAQTKIKVKDAGAVIRIEPADKGEIVQDKLVPGTVYAVESKSGDWYEIKYRSAIGVLLSGYIHKSQVEEVADAPAPKATPARTETFRESSGEPRGGLEIGLSGGLALSSFKSGAGSFTDTWGAYYSLQSVTETGSLNFSLGNSIDLAASLAYFFTPQIGIRFQFDMPFKRTFSSGLMDYNMSWNWYGYSTYTRNSSYDVTGDTSVIPLSLNGVFRFPMGASMDAYITGGPTYFMGKVNAATKMGLGWTWLAGSTQYIDYFPVPLNISESVNGIGFNVGAGLDLKIGETLKAFIEANYFMGPSKSLSWIAQPGTYPSTLSAGFNLNVDQATIDDLSLSTRMSALDVKMSFLKLAAGIKIGL